MILYFNNKESAEIFAAKKPYYCVVFKHEKWGVVVKKPSKISSEKN
jgi:hypothetical protein